MNQTSLLNQFAKGKDESTLTHNSRNAVIYTRVSSKEQAETNQSLEVQKKYCLQYALKQEMNVLGFFGGTYESAKTDEREEFNRMIRFVKNQREGVSTILVYSLDRFSRTGDNAIFISSELKRRGISITSVTQPIDVSTHSGVLQQNIQFIFSKYDNDLRREKCIAGMKEKLLKGEWVGWAPIGYSYDHTVGRHEQKIAPNDKGPLIRKAFELKIQGRANSEIALQLKQWGLAIDRKRLSEILRNPFYAGLLAHNFLEGRLIKGKHEPIISEEMFLQANDMLKKNAFGYKQEQKNINIPLKNFVRCGDCGTPMTGYLVKKKELYYYKCNKIGCCNNRSAKFMHQSFIDLMSSYQLNKELIAPLQAQLMLTYEDFSKGKADTQAIAKSRLKELNNKLTTMEERFAYGEIDRDIFNRVAGKLRLEIRALEESLEGTGKKLSNPSKVIGECLEICAKLGDLWVSGGYNEKVKLQELLFPEGIFFERQNDVYRTPKVNAIIELIRAYSLEIKGNKKGQIEKIFHLSDPVAPTGIEPVSKV